MLLPRGSRDQRLHVEFASVIGDKLVDLLADIFPNMAQRAEVCARAHGNDPDITFFKERAILAPKNVDVNEINDMALEALKSTQRLPH